MALPDSPLDLENPEVGARVEVREGRLWVCVDGQCVLRVRGCKVIEVADFRTDPLLMDHDRWVQAIGDPG